jgi:hypothetical protein
VYADSRRAHPTPLSHRAHAHACQFEDSRALLSIAPPRGVKRDDDPDEREDNDGHARIGGGLDGFDGRPWSRKLRRRLK